MKVFAEKDIEGLKPRHYYKNKTLSQACSVDAQEGDYLAVVSKEDGTDEYIDILGQI